MLNLAKREKNVLTAGGVFIVVFLFVQLFYFPAVDKRKSLENALETKQKKLKEMGSLQQQYLSLSGSMDGQKDAILTRNKNFSLFLFLDTEAKKSGVKDNVAYMKPFSRDIDSSKYKIARVKVKLNQVYLKELVDFLYLVESSENQVSITSISLSKTGKQKNLLDAVIEAETLMLKGSV